MKQTHEAVTGRGSSLRKYQDVMVGSTSLFKLIYFEWCMLLSVLPGALGMVLRKIFWPGMFGSCGKGVMFGAGIVIRHPSRIHLGDNVILSEQCILDGRSPDEAAAIRLEENAIMSNQVMLSCKNGTIFIGANTGINAQTIIQSTNRCPVKIGRDCIIGQQCFIVGGGSYNYNQVDIPIREQGIRPDGGVDIRSDVWLGGKVTVLGGVTLGSGAVIGAGAVVTRSVPEYSVCMGVPAEVVKNRKDDETGIEAE